MAGADSTAGRWACIRLPLGDEVHVYPLADLVAHDLTEGQCVCGPLVELHTRPDARDAYMYVHHALDGRERYERAASD